MVALVDASPEVLSMMPLPSALNFATYSLLCANTCRRPSQLRRKGWGRISKQCADQCHRRALQDFLDYHADERINQHIGVSARSVPRLGIDDAFNLGR
jgi:hypothetical protein